LPQLRHFVLNCLRCFGPTRIDRRTARTSAGPGDGGERPPGAYIRVACRAWVGARRSIRREPRGRPLAGIGPMAATCAASGGLARAAGVLPGGGQGGPVSGDPDRPGPALARGWGSRVQFRPIPQDAKQRAYSAGADQTSVIKVRTQAVQFFPNR